MDTRIRILSLVARVTDLDKKIRRHRGLVLKPL